MMLRFFAVLLTGLALIAPGAHVYEIANKIPLPKAEYLVVQKIYTGWSMAGLLLPISLLANLALAYAESNLLALTATILLLANLMIFYFFTYPPNVATVNWAVIPDNWEPSDDSGGVPSRQCGRDIAGIRFVDSCGSEKNSGLNKRKYRWPAL